MKVNQNKFFGYQIIAVLIIWLGMTVFFKKLDSSGVIIYYVVTFWLLFLLVLFFNNMYKQRIGQSIIVFIVNIKNDDIMIVLVIYLLIYITILSLIIKI